MTGDGGLNQLLGVFPQQARGLAVGRPDDGAACRVGGLLVDARSGERGVVGKGGVAAGVPEIDWIVRRDRVQAIVQGRALDARLRRLIPLVLMPAAPEYPVPGIGAVHRHSDLRDDVVPTRRAG